MAKWTDYFISGVWKDNTGNITHVMLHEVNEKNEYVLGVKTPVSTVISLINKNYSVITITWNYPSWKRGAKVIVVNEKGIEYLRTVANSTEKDNLDNSIPMNDFNI
jgi:hypothetical protein